MLITNFNDISSFNHFWNDGIDRLHNCRPLTEELYVLLSFNRLDIVKAHVESGASVSNYVEQIQQNLPEQYQTIVSEYHAKFKSEHTAYVYPYSSTKFFNNMFKEILPSAAKKLYSLIFNDSSFIQMYDSTATSFKGCILFKMVPTLKNLKEINDAVFNIVSSDSVTVLQDVLSHLELIVQDNEAYKNYILELESAVINLNSKIDLLQKEGMNGYLLSWH